MSKLPQTILAEHQQIHDMLMAAKKSGGRTGAAAKEAAKIIHPHLLAEEEYALPPIAILPDIVAGKITPQMRIAMRASQHLKADMAIMLDSHRRIESALDTLMAIAQEEGKEDVVAFAKMLKLHAQHEEEVLYPAAVLVGEYLKLKLK